MQLIAGILVVCVAVLTPLWAARVVLAGIVAFLGERQNGTQAQNL